MDFFMFCLNIVMLYANEAIGNTLPPQHKETIYKHFMALVRAVSLLYRRSDGFYVSNHLRSKKRNVANKKA